MLVPFPKRLSAGSAEPRAGLDELLPPLRLVPLHNTLFPRERTRLLLLQGLWEQELPSAALTEELVPVQALIAMSICAPALRENIDAPRALPPLLLIMHSPLAAP